MYITLHKYVHYYYFGVPLYGLVAEVSGLPAAGVYL